MNIPLAVADKRQYARLKTQIRPNSPAPPKLSYLKEWYDPLEGVKKDKAVKKWLFRLI